mmetsp:Transcript_1686/g.1899  ORF Transcript_1686/g.1899 Transcript_1686/m.1899 type:complete len:779 (+) Transcript_1686:110-2446(+)
MKLFRCVFFMKIILISVFMTAAHDRSNESGTRLTAGLVTRTDVEMYADLALDVRDIRELIALKQSEKALDLYLNGRNAVHSSASSAMGYKRKFTLHELSQSLASKPNIRTSSYIYHLYGLADRNNAVNKLQDQAFYADSFVRTRIARSSKSSGDAIVALHLWMYATHVLYDGLNTCRLLSNGGLPDLVSKLNGGGMDEFIGIWIGQDQEDGTMEGHSLYSMTERAQSLFTPSTISNSLPEAATNTNIRMLYQKGITALSFLNACSNGNEDTVRVLWSVTQEIISTMYIPLMQLLLDALYRKDSESIQLYAMALIPQLCQCRPSVYKHLKESLLDGMVNVNRIDQIVQDLQSVYECLGFSCQDIGVYKIGADNNNIPISCEDTPEDQLLAEYHPKSKVHWKARIDLDILQMGILTSLHLYHSAEHLYLHGRNVIENRHITQPYDDEPRKVISLHALAIDSNRKIADPYYSDFVKYHNKPNYADEAILQTLRKQGSWGTTASSEQATAVVTKTASFQILYIAILSNLATSVEYCNEAHLGVEDADDLLPWDEAAALLIGSLEGPNEGGSYDLEDGQLFWNLADKRANQFHTNNNEGYSLINEELEDLLFAGRAAAMTLDCENLERSADRIRHLIMLPLIQSTIRYAVLNQGLSASSKSVNLALGEVYSLAVLPLVSKYDDNAAQVIQENMVIRTDARVVPDGPQKVSNAFYQALDDFGYSCALVGFTIQADACQLAGGFAKVKPEFDLHRNSNDSSGSASLLQLYWNMSHFINALMIILL